MSARGNMPNFFELLNLDPNLPWEPQGRMHYETRLEAQRAKWANQRTAPGKRGADATRYFKMVMDGTIDAEMRDATKREAQRQERLQSLADKRHKLDAALNTWKAEATSVTSRQIKHWSHSFEVDEATVERRAQEVGLTVAAEVAPGSAQRLNPVTERKIRETLEALTNLDPGNASKYKTLYTLLSETLYTLLKKTPDDSSDADLLAAAQALNNALQKNSNKTDILTKEMALAGDAMNTFKTAADRAQYDEALRLAPLERLLDEMEIATGGVAPRAGHIDTYFRAAGKEGFEADDIRGALEFRAQRNKWGVIEIPRRPTEGLCPFCAEFVALDGASCPACGKLLTLTCPNCGEGKIPVERPACPKCGFRTGQRGWVIELVNEARAALASGREARAQTLLEEASRLWTPATPDIIVRSLADVGEQVRHWQRQQLAEKIQRQLNKADNAITQAQYATARSLVDDARTRWMPDHPEKDDLVAQMKKLDDKLAPHEAKIQQARREAVEQERLRMEAVSQLVKGIESSVADHNLVAAQTRLRGLSPAERQRADIASLAQHIDDGVARAEEQVRRAKGAPLAEERIRLCYAALDICADLPAALDMLKASRPPAPRSVNPPKISGASDAATIEVSWSESPEERVTYAVRRKVGAVPASERDGDIIPCDPAARRAVDERPPHGVEVYYAVFAIRERAHVYSAPASSPVAVVLADDVRKAHAQALDRSVKLSWEPPEQVQAVVIVRTEGAPPRSHEDGAPVRSAVDKGLTNGTVYYYGIYCRYAGEVISHGVVAQATPHARPTIPPPLQISGRLNSVGWCEVTLRWGDAANGADDSSGRRVAYRIDPTPLFHSGAELSEGEAQRHIWNTVEMRQGYGEDRLSQPGIVLYAPAVIVAGIVYSGAPQRFPFIPAIEQAEAHSVVGAVRISWTWPPQVTDALITTGPVVAAEYASEEALRGTGALLVSRNDTASDQARYDVPGQARRRLRLQIAPVIRSDGRLITGAPIALQGEAAEMGDMTYEFSRPSGIPFARSASYSVLLRIHNRGPLTTLPPLVARFKEGSEPQNRADGEEWWTYAEQPLPKNELRLSLPDLPERPGSGALYGAVFFAKDEQARFARLVSAGANKTRLR